jgi:hypothetical protein
MDSGTAGKRICRPRGFRVPGEVVRKIGSCCPLRPVVGVVKSLILVPKNKRLKMFNSSVMILTIKVKTQPQGFPINQKEK